MTNQTTITGPNSIPTSRRATRLDHEQANENHQRDGDDVGLEDVRRDLEPFDRARAPKSPA